MIKIYRGLFAIALLLSFVGSCLGQTSGMRPEQFIAQNWAWSGAQTQAPCPLTDAATITVSAQNCGANGTFAATIAGTTMTVTGSPIANLQVGAQISGGAVPTGTFITALGTGTGGTGTYTINRSLNAAVSATLTATYSTAINRVTLGGNRTLAFPGDLLPGNFAIYEFTQDATGSRGLVFGAGYQFPLQTVPVQCGVSVTQNCISTTPGAIDAISCYSTSTSVYRCGYVLTNEGAPIYTITSSAIGGDCGSVSSCASTSITASLNDTFFALITFCDSATGCALNQGGTRTTTISSLTKSSGTAVVGTCTQLTGATALDTTTSNLAERGFLYACKVTTGGTLVLTAALSASSGHVQVSTFSVAGITTGSYDDGKGNGNSSATTYNISTNGAITQSSEFIVNALFTASGGSLPTNASGYTAINSAATSGMNILLQYQVSGASGTTPNASGNWGAGSTPGAAIIAGVFHP